MTDRFISVGEAARLLGRSDESVYRLARAGKLAYYRDEETRTWRFSLASIEAYIASRLVPARPVLRSLPTPRERRRAGEPTSDEPWKGSIFGRPNGANGQTESRRSPDMKKVRAGH